MSEIFVAARGVYPSLTPWSKFPLPFPFPPLLPSLSFSLPSPPLPLEVAPPLLRLGSLVSIWLAGPGRARGRQTVFGEFQVKNLASSSNNLQELFRK